MPIVECWHYSGWMNENLHYHFASTINEPDHAVKQLAKISHKVTHRAGLVSNLTRYTLG